MKVSTLNKRKSLSPKNDGKKREADKNQTRVKTQ